MFGGRLVASVLHKSRRLGGSLKLLPSPWILHQARLCQLTLQIGHCEML